MFLLNWLREWKEIRQQYNQPEEKICQSCETLKMQLAIANQEKERLLDRLLEKPEPEKVIETENLKPIQTAAIPWNTRRQMLEAADRKKAQELRDKDKEIEDLEKKLNIKEA